MARQDTIRDPKTTHTFSNSLQGLQDSEAIVYYREKIYNRISKGKKIHHMASGGIYTQASYMCSVSPQGSPSRILLQPVCRYKDQPITIKIPEPQKLSRRSEPQGSKSVTWKTRNFAKAKLPGSTQEPTLHSSRPFWREQPEAYYVSSSLQSHKA